MSSRLHFIAFCVLPMALGMFGPSVCPVVAQVPGQTFVSQPSPSRPHHGKVAGTDSRFTVTVKTFVGAQSDPIAEHRIVFDNGLIYDLPQIDSATVTVYDPAQGHVTLMDRPRQVQSTISIDDLVKITAQARASADTPDKQEQLGLTATVQKSNRMIGYSIHFAGATYHMSTQKPAHPTMASEFGQFSDLAARMNLVRQSWLPPFARMTLSDRITAAGEIPLETSLTIQRGDRTDEYRTTMLIGELTEDDAKSIQEVRGMLTLYKTVSLDEVPKA
ncbi:hypothetical protein K227x_28600 [Rubripirellula lacrimiformis]|uniref:Secreted protein n=1 Tax=Rubripirellula lacrimiformis TaxID=1930273 RepID=A0A517NBF5_9BACT|nr:hypothetical protein [Rubripirellula lacrimiformis]QDT04469.1 hypothetical protein K227x_28600 [Rubripirellula lacrimiformis]